MSERPSVTDSNHGGASPGNFRLGETGANATLPSMSRPADALRRWLGLFCLAMAAGMLSWGLIVLRSRLEGVWFLGYWGLCFLFTFCALIIGLLDAHAVRTRVREEQRELIRQTLGEIEQAKKEKQTQPGKEQPPPA